jgi:hypothetical protein
MPGSTENALTHNGCELSANPKSLGAMIRSNEHLLHALTTRVSTADGQPPVGRPVQSRRQLLHCHSMYLLLRP